MGTEFAENLEGGHLINGEFTLCGDSFDIAETEKEFEHGHLSPTHSRIVTCLHCVAIIHLCRRVRTDV
jgi:hypothetical protein